MIRQKAKSVLKKAFGSSMVSRDGINVAVSCPECDSSGVKKKLSVRLDDYRYHCWVCGLKGKNVWKYISKKFPEVSIDEALFKARREDVSETIEIESLELPKGFVPVFRKTSDPDVRAVRSYLNSRGIKNSDMLRWRILTCPSGRFRRRVIVPSFDNEGELNYYIGRSIDNSSFKYLNAKVSKTEIIFNEIDIDWRKPIVLVEGVFDAIKSVENTIPLLGSSLPESSYLFKKIMREQSEVTLSLDPDLKDKSLMIAKKLYQAGCRVKVCFTRDGSDMGDSSKEENKQLIKSASFFTPYSHLSHRISSIRSGSII